MPTVGTTYLTLADLRRQQNKDDTIADIIEIMAQQNDIYADAPTVECNSGDEHLTTLRSSLPAPTWRKLYQPVMPTKGTATQVKDSTAYAEDWSEVDAKLVEKAKNPQKFRMNEAKAHIMGIAHDVASLIFYGDTKTAPEKFMGLHARYDDRSAPQGNQIIHGGGTGSDNTSIWFITWGENTVHLLYPEGSQAGLRREDKGQQTKETTGGLYDVYREKFAQDIGLSVRDWRSVSRIANIDVPALGGNSAADLVDLMVDAYYALDNPGVRTGNTVIYCNRTIASYLHKQAASKASNQLTLETFEGRPVTAFLGYPIRRCDAILDTEGTVL